MVSCGHSAPQDLIDDQRRHQIVGAVAELAQHRRVVELTVAEIAAQAGISRATFYGLFDNRNDCLRFSCLEAERRIFDPVRGTLEQDLPWIEQMSAALAAFLDATVAAPRLARLCLVDAEPVEGVRGASLDLGIASLRETIRAGRAAGRELRGADYFEPPPCTEDLLANGVVFVVGHRLTTRQADTIADLHAELLRLCALPFLGDYESRPGIGSRGNPP